LAYSVPGFTWPIEDMGPTMRVEMLKRLHKALAREEADERAVTRALAGRGRK